MEQSIQRARNEPITAQPIEPATSTNRGHHQRARLQREPEHARLASYACIFELPPSLVRSCTDAAYTTSDPTQRRGCDCKETRPTRRGSQPPAMPAPLGGSAETTQYGAKAFRPAGTSICSKACNLAVSSDPSVPRRSAATRPRRPMDTMRCSRPPSRGSTCRSSEVLTGEGDSGSNRRPGGEDQRNSEQRNGWPRAARPGNRSEEVGVRWPAPGVVPRA